jgi:prepilin-type N-terminal cleavage/methylation domain-containing protein
MKARIHPSGFTLLEMLVATAVFSLMIVMLLQLTSGLLTNANRMDENLKIDQEVRILFDLMRRDLAQARIATNQNQFYGSSNQVCFVSSASRLKTNFVSDQRLVTYYYESNAIWRAVVDPKMEFWSNVWNPLSAKWWEIAGFQTNIKTNAEALLEGVYPYSTDYPDPFTYVLRDGTRARVTDPANPPSGLTIGFAVASRRATRTGRDSAENTSEMKQMKYDIELNIPPAFNP